VVGVVGVVVVVVVVMVVYCIHFHSRYKHRSTVVSPCTQSN
jgi:hypothetical protein